MNSLKSLFVFASLCALPFAARADDTNLATTAPSAAACARAAATSYVQRRVIEKAAQGIAPLAQYVHRTRTIYQLDLIETVAWLDARREALQACAERVALMAPSGG